MASDKEFMDFIADQLNGSGCITYKKMFGEYGVYSDGIIFALVCDNKLFIKPTKQGRVFIGNVIEVPPYQGAKPYFLIEEKLEDREWLRSLIRITVKELAEAKK